MKIFSFWKLYLNRRVFVMIRDSISTKVVQMMCLGWPFYGNVKFASLCICMEKNIENSISHNVLMTNGWDLQCMIWVANSSVTIKFGHPELCALALGLYTISLKIFFSETAWQSFTRFHTGPSDQGVLSICSNGFASLNKMAAITIYGKKRKTNKQKKTLKSSSPEPRKLQGWILLQSIGNSRSCKFVQMMTQGWHFFFFLHQGQICVPMHLYVENIENSVFRNV